MIVVHDENTEKLTRMLTDEAINIAYNQAIDHAIAIVEEQMEKPEEWDTFTQMIDKLKKLQK